MSAVRVGDRAPDFTLQAHDGTTVRLEDFRGKQGVVLIFYPADQTPGCTAQLCAARDDADRYAAAGVAVFGVNSAGAASHRRFVERYHLRTPLLVDDGLRVSTAYDAATGFGPVKIIKRTVVGISPEGKVVYYRRGLPSTDEILSARPRRANRSEVPESTSNVEFAHHVHEMGQERPGGHGRWLGIAEAVVLAIVAVATAWSGYQAARWDALSSQDYSLQGRYTVLSQEKATLAGQDRLYDTVTFNGWVAAKVSGREKLAAFYERRFRPEYAVAFKAWWRLDPIHSPSAPPGPTFMPQYRNANLRASDELSAQASTAYESAVDARERGDSYVEATVFLATVLFLTAVSQRFEVFGARVTVVVVAALLLVGSTGWLVTLPRR